MVKFLHLLSPGQQCEQKQPCAQGHTGTLCTPGPGPMQWASQSPPPPSPSTLTPRMFCLPQSSSCPARCAMLAVLSAPPTGAGCAQGTGKTCRPFRRYRRGCQSRRGSTAGTSMQCPLPCAYPAPRSKSSAPSRQRRDSHCIIATCSGRANPTLLCPSSHLILLPKNASPHGLREMPRRAGTRMRRG